MLSPSQRIKTIREIAARVEFEPWSMIDLMLSQFDLPTREEWRGDTQTYIVAMIEGAPDDALLGLAEHLDIPVPGASPAAVAAVVSHPPFWEKDRLRVFISHLAAHRKFTGELQDKLSLFGISAFVAHKDIAPTSEWQNEIERALATCDAMVALLHPDFHASNWTDQEIGFAMGRGVPIFSVRLGQDPYGFIGKFQAFNGVGKTALALAQELFAAYAKNKQLQGRIPEILVSLLEDSRSFDHAKARARLLEDAPAGNKTLSERIRAAVRSNPQIKDAWGVPEKLVAIADRWSPPPARPSTPPGASTFSIDDEIPF